jgi:LacI family transcriptional regulator
VAHRFRIREIAQQSGLSEATVDRVLNRRGGVRASTVSEVERAISDLDRQNTQVRLAGRTFLVDIVMSAPRRFSAAVQEAMESEQPSLRPAVFRSRFHFSEQAGPSDIAATLGTIARRGSQGVILKAPDRPEVVEAIAELSRAGIPVVTLVTDVAVSRRLAYIGIDNRAAGATAAYLITQWLGRRRGNVLVTLSSESFRGEEEREMGFRVALRELAPRRVIREITETGGLDEPMRRLVRRVLRADPSVAAVYSIGGGNVATVETFADLGHDRPVVIAHDLDVDNTRLLRAGDVAGVLHHDLRQDARRACQVIMQAHGVLPGPILSIPSAIQVITPYNQP